jgi:hypothetical protein
LRRAEIGKVFAVDGAGRLGHSFDCDDLGIDGFNAEHQARKHGRAVNKYGASAAFSQLATMFGAGETHVLAQNFQQSFVNLRGDLLGFAVDAKAKEDFTGRLVLFLLISRDHFSLLSKVRS